MRYDDDNNKFVLARVNWRVLEYRRLAARGAHQNASEGSGSSCIIRIGKACQDREIGADAVDGLGRILLLASVGQAACGPSQTPRGRAIGQGGQTRRTRGW